MGHTVWHIIKAIYLNVMNIFKAPSKLPDKVRNEFQKASGFEFSKHTSKRK